MWPKEQRETKHIVCAVVQVWEMTSLFVLFSFFYMKSYRNKKSSDEDQCQKAVKEGMAGAAQAVESAAKNAGKLTSSVKGKKSSIRFF